jgi:predicted dehydrogenase
MQCVILQFGAGAAQWSLTHASDLMLFLAGDPQVEFVQGAIGAKDEDWEGSDRLNVDPAVYNGYVRFANGAHGYITAGSGVEVEVCCARGKLRTHNNGVECTLRKVTGQHGLFEPAPFPQVERSSGTVAGLRDIAEALDTGRETKGNVELARRSQEIMLGIIESHRLGGQRVPLPMAHRSLYVGRADW